MNDSQVFSLIPIKRYSLPLLASTTAFLLTLILWPILKETPALLFFASVMISAWYGGFPSGLLATALALSCLYYLFGYPTFNSEQNGADIARLAMFAGVAVLISSLNESRRRAEETARKKEEQMRLIADAVPAPICYVDTAQRYRFNNKAYQEWFGNLSEKIPGKHLEEILGITTYQTIRNHLDTVLSGERVTSEMELKTADGVARYIQATYIPHFAKQRAVQGFVTAISDLTERKRNEEALEKERDLIEAIVSSAHSLIVVLDRQGQIIRFNQACQDLTGYSLAEVKRKYLWDLFLPEAEVEPVKQVFCSLREGNFPNKYKGEWIAKSGSRHLISWSNTAIVNREGQVEYVIATGIDITDRQATEIALAASHSQLETRIQERTAELLQINQALQAEITEREKIEAALRESEERFRSLSACSPVGIFTTDIEGRCTYTNPRWQAISGLTLEESLEGGWVQAIHPEERDRFLAEWSENNRNRQEYAGEFRSLTSEGTVRWIYVRSAPIFSPSNQPSGCVGTLQDITERRQIETALSRSEQQLKTVVENTPDVSCDRQGRYLYVNPVVEKIQGMPASAILGKTSQELGIGPELCQLWEETIAKVFESGIEHAIEYQVPNPSGSRTFQSRIVPEFDQSGQVQSVLVAARDITELKQAEIHKAQLLAEQTARAKAEAQQQRSAFLAEVSNLLAASLESETALSNVATASVPAIADGCLIHLLDASGVCHRVAIAHTEPGAIALIEALEQRYPLNPNADHGYPLVLRTGQPELILEVSDSILTAVAHNAEHLEMLRQLNLGSNLCVPLIARGRVLGAISFITTQSGRRYSSEDQALLADLAYRCAIAADNARLYREAQEALAQTAESFASIDALLAAAPLGLCFLDRQMRFLRINQVLADLNGLSIEAHLGQEMRAILPECATRFEPLIQQVLDTGEPLLNQEISGKPPGKPGYSGHWLGSYYPVKSQDSQVLGVGLILTEITAAKEAQEALAESEARFRSVVESNMIGIGFWEGDGRIADANDALLQMVGYSREALIAGKLRWTDLTPPEYQALDQQAIAQLQALGCCKPYEKEYLRSDGSRFPVLAGGGHLQGCQDRGAFFILDISDRKQAEEAERQANRKLANILESITDAFFALNREWEFTYINNRCLSLFGRDREELLGTGIWEVFPQLVGTVFYEQYHKAMYQQIPTHIEALGFLQPERWCEVHAYPWSDGLAVYIQDISKRKRTELALRESQVRVGRQLAELDHLYNATPVGLCFVDTSLRFVRINEHLAAINGPAIAQHLGRTIREVLPEMADTLEALYNKVIETKQPLLNQEIQGMTVQQPGMIRDWLVSHYPIIDESGVLLGVSSVVQEISDRKRAERALRQSEAIFRRLFEANVFGVAIGDNRGRITYANDALLKMVGYTRQEMLAGQMRWDTMTPPEYFHLDARAAEELRATGVATPFEKEYLRSDGSRIPILMGAAMLNEPDPCEETQIGFYIDLTEIKRVEAELKKNQERLQLAQQTGKIGTFEWNIQTGESTWTQELEALYGLPPGTYQGKYDSWLQLVHPDDRETTDGILKAVAASGGELETEFRICRPDGSLRWIACRATVLPDDRGRPQRMVGVNVDISDRKQVEEVLLETNHTLEALIKGCPLGITVFTATDGTVRMWNPAAEKIFGWSEQEVLGSILPSVPKDKGEEFASYLAQIRDGKALTALETRRQRKDGSLIEISLWATPVYDAKGNINCMSIMADITDRKRAEAERDQLLAREQAARTEAETMNRMKDEFLATLSHELRTPLNAILGWSQLLRTRKFNEVTTSRALDTIERQARVQAQLIDDLLDVSRIIQGKLCLNVGWFDLAEVIEAAMNSVGLMAQAKSIELECDLAPGLGLIWGDAERLQQVVWNLLSNAIKFTPNGGVVEVKISTDGQWEAETTPPQSLPAGQTLTAPPLTSQYAIIQVSDTGKGIEPEFLPFVFERFRQADGSITRLYGGLGLGLAIVRHLVELHGGTVTAESEGEGKGATFTVRLPLRQVRGSGAQLPWKGAVEEEVAEKPNAAKDALEGVQVLVVDDDPDTRDFLIALLEEYGAAAIAVSSASEAIAALAHWQPDVLVSDIGMPVEDGYSLIQKVRSLESGQSEHLPAVALTAYAREQDRYQALKAGFNEHLPKPVEPDELLDALVKLVGGII